MTRSKPSKSSQYLDVYLGAELKEKWTAYCQQRGLKPGAALKHAIHQQLSQPDETPALYRQIGPASEDEQKSRFEILLTASEKAALRDMAEREECSMRRWVIDAIRVRLTREPQFSSDEIRELGESNYQLLAIGRNLNQIARHLNQGEAAQLTREQISALKQDIDEHTDTVSAAIRASLERWEVGV